MSSSSSRKVSCSPTESSSSGCRYKGVRKRKWGKWVSEIRLPNSRERIWLGSYDSPEKAARAFDAALFCLRGRSASFNFPDSPPDIDGGRSLAPAQIQVAAAQFAHAHRNPPPPPDHYSDHSGGTVQMDHSEWTAEAAGSSSPHQYNNNVPDFGIFPGFDDLPGEYFGSLQPPMDYGGDDRWDGDDVAEESFLWNF